MYRIGPPETIVNRLLRAHMAKPKLKRAAVPQWVNLPVRLTVCLGRKVYTDKRTFRRLAWYGEFVPKGEVAVPSAGQHLCL